MMKVTCVTCAEGMRINNSRESHFKVLREIRSRYFSGTVNATHETSSCVKSKYIFMELNKNLCSLIFQKKYTFLRYQGI